MSRSTAKNRPEWIKERIAQAYAAAENGDGWIELGKLWGASNASAHQWCQPRLPPEICQKIGMNGRVGRERGKCRKYDYIRAGAEDAIRSPGERRRYTTCQHWHYFDRKLTQCGNPTENGKPTCDDCRHIEGLRPGPTYKNYTLTGMVST